MIKKLRIPSSDHHTFPVIWKSENASSLVQLSLKPSLKEHLLKKLIRKCSHSCSGVPWWLFFARQHLLFTVLTMKCKKNYLGERICSSSVFSSGLLLLFPLQNFLRVAAVVIFIFPTVDGLWAVSWGLGLIPARLTWEQQTVQLRRGLGHLPVRYRVTAVSAVARTPLSKKRCG